MRRKRRRLSYPDHERDPVFAFAREVDRYLEVLQLGLDTRRQHVLDPLLVEDGGIDALVDTGRIVFVLGDTVDDHAAASVREGRYVLT